MVVSHERWHAARVAVRAAGDRFAELVSARRSPEAAATSDWSVAETAAHVSAIAALYTSLVRPGDVPHPFPDLQGQILATTVDTVADLNEQVLHRFPERSPEALAGRLRADVDDLLAATVDRDPAEPVTWLGGSRVPLAGVLAHLLNELLVHGRDVARARPTRGPGDDRRVRWTIPPADAALFFDLFLVEVLRHGYGQLLDTDEPPRDRRIAVEFRSRHTAPVAIVLHRGRASVEEPGRDIDVRLSFAPATLNLVLFGRVSRSRAAFTGKLVVRGPRPWLLPAFLRTVRLPR